MQGSYRLANRDGRIMWLEGDCAMPTFYTTEPDSHLTRRIAAWLVGVLPIKSQL